MKFDCAYVIGAGPVGLTAALKLKEIFTRVVVVERRSNYTRQNVPTAGSAFRDLVQDVTPSRAQAPAWSGPAAGPVPLSRIESDLFALAQARRITVLSGTKLTGFGGEGRPGAFGSFTRVRVMLSRITSEGRNGAPDQVAFHSSDMADFIVVAVGGGAVMTDPQILRFGFEHAALQAECHGFYMLFQGEDGKAPNKAERRQAVGFNVDSTSFSNVKTSGGGREYLLAVPRGMTDQDWAQLEGNRKLFERFAKTLAMAYGMNGPKQIADWQDAYGHFMVAARRARSFFSPDYPAILVGDAAVLPNPQNGTGLDAGAMMVTQMAEVLAALKQKTRKGTAPDDADVTLRMDMDRALEHVVFHKALMETETLCKNLQVTLDPLIRELDTQTPGLVATLCREIAKDLRRLHEALEHHRADAAALLGNEGMPARLVTGILRHAGGGKYATKAAKLLGLPATSQRAAASLPNAPQVDMAALNEMKQNWRSLEAPEAGMPSLLWELWRQIDETYVLFKSACENADKGLGALGKQQPSMKDRVKAAERV